MRGEKLLSSGSSEWQATMKGDIKPLTIRAMEEKKKKAREETGTIEIVSCN